MAHKYVIEKDDMERRVLAIPLEEVKKHFEINNRQDIKIVAPTILSDERYEELKKRGKNPKKEQELIDSRWINSPRESPNNICLSGDFVYKLLPGTSKGPFTISFANQKAAQDEHYHEKHFEIYYSESPISIDYRFINDPASDTLELKEGGLIVIAPNVIHKAELRGLTVVIELESVDNDRKTDMRI